MPSKEYYFAEKFKCPFYQGNGYCRITCEGGSRMLFPRDADAREHMRLHCTSIDGWKDCSIAKMLSRYYDSQED